MKMANIHTHRVAFLLENGRLPSPFGLHRCDNPPCCNPAHIFEGTPLDNMQDKIAKGRWKGGGAKGKSLNRGTSNPNARLTPDDVREIRRLRSQGVSRAVVGEKFGITYFSVRDVEKRITWGHVSDDSDERQPPC